MRLRPVAASTSQSGPLSTVPKMILLRSGVCEKLPVLPLRAPQSLIVRELSAGFQIA